MPGTDLPVAVRQAARPWQSPAPLVQTAAADDFVRAVVLYSCSVVVPFGDNQLAVPIEALRQ